MIIAAVLCAITLCFTVLTGFAILPEGGHKKGKIKLDRNNINKLLTQDSAEVTSKDIEKINSDLEFLQEAGVLEEKAQIKEIKTSKKIILIIMLKWASMKMRYLLKNSPIE